MYKVIMLPTEGSENEAPAISLAVRLSQRFDAELHLVRVHTVAPTIDPVPVTGLLPRSDEALRAERLVAKESLESLGDQCGHFGVVTALVEGPVGPALRDYADRKKIDLIVMSSRSRSGLSRLTLGSVTDYLIRHTNVPVLVARQSATPIGSVSDAPFERIVVPLDGSALAEEILPQVAELASRRKSTVSLLHVLTPVTYAQHEIMQPGLPWWDEEIADAQAYLERAATYLVERGLTVGKEIVLTEDVATAIMDYSLRARADLIAIATRGIGGISRLVFGTVADEVTRKSPTSVLVFHPRAGAADVPPLRARTRAMVEAR